MKTVTGTTKYLDETVGTAADNRGLSDRVQPFLRLMGGAFLSLSEGMRRVRAYNELHRMDNRTLQDLGCRPGEIDRVLNGHLPRPSRKDD